MPSTRRKIAPLSSLAAATITIGGLIVASSSPAHAYVYSTEAQYGSWSQGSWTIYNDVWGNPNPSQWLNVNDITSWNVSSNQTGNGVKSYPNTQVDPNTPLPQMKSATATFNFSSPSSGSVYDWIFDLWTANSADELMVAETWTTPTGGWGKEIASNVTIGQSTFSQVWQANPGWNVLMFFRNQQRTSGSEDLLAIMNWANSKGLLHNNVFASFPFGVEVTSTSGWQTFSLNSYAASWSNTSGGGSTIGSQGGPISNGNHTLTPQNATGSRLDANGWGTTNGTKVQIWQASGGTNQSWSFTNQGGSNYTISPSYDTALCLDVSGFGTANGTLAQLWGCTGASNQLWGAIGDGGNVYEFAPQNATGSRLDVSGFGTANGTQVQIWQSTGGSNQKWAVN